MWTASRRQSGWNGAAGEAELLWAGSRSAFTLRGMGTEALSFINSYPPCAVCVLQTVILFCFLLVVVERRLCLNECTLREWSADSVLLFCRSWKRRKKQKQRRKRRRRSRPRAGTHLPMAPWVWDTNPAAWPFVLAPLVVQVSLLARLPLLLSCSLRSRLCLGCEMAQMLQLATPFFTRLRWPL